jgi:hypothetical protein
MNGLAIVVIDGRELHKLLEGRFRAFPVKRVLRVFLSSHRMIAFSVRQELPSGRLVRNRDANLFGVTGGEAEADQGAPG